MREERGFSMHFLVQTAEAVGADIDGGDNADHSTGYPGYGASFIFDESQLSAFVALIRNGSAEWSDRAVYEWFFREVLALPRWNQHGGSIKCAESGQFVMSGHIDEILQEAKAKVANIAETAAQEAANLEPAEIWAASQLAPGEGMEDGINRVASIIGKEAAKPVVRNTLEPVGGICRCGDPECMHFNDKPVVLDEEPKGCPDGVHPTFRYGYRSGWLACRKAMIAAVQEGSK